MISSVAILAASAAAVAIPVPANAAQPVCLGHCYGFAKETIYDNITAMSAELAVGCLYVPDQSAQFVNWEMWLATRADRPNESDWNWIEAGITAGSLRAPGNTRGFQWFWADRYKPYGTDPGSYFEHFIGWATKGTYSNLSFYWTPNSSGIYGWSVYQSGVYRGWSGVGGWPADPELGAESTDGNVMLDGYANDWRTRDKANQWRQAGGSTFVIQGGAAFNGNRPAQGKVRAWTPWWDCNGNHPNGALGATSTESSNVAQLMKSSTGVRQVLTTTTEQLVSRLGSGNVKTAKFVRSDRDVAVARHKGSEVYGKQAVYVVQVAGAFSKAGKNGERMDGSVLEVVVDAATGEITDWGITSDTRGLNSLGVVKLLG
ncbi:hypothetical protein [Micromonospora chersina]|uniref:hypothetical protein n=1 Tax=Micromonospora chersina TaxID=47854 RepID=UPI00371F6223